MNYLAHFYLSHETEPAVIGSILGDFVKGPIENTHYAEETRQAIRLHRAIDSYTDKHAIVKSSKSRLSTPFRRYGGILLDVFYDHFLARNWAALSNITLTDFSQSIYKILEANRHEFPERLQRIVPYMVEDDWLGSYIELENIQRALLGLSRRLRRDNPLPTALSELEKNYENFEQDFFEFFASLNEFVQSHKQQSF